MTTTHTPGPWTAKTSDHAWQILDEGGYRIATVNTRQLGQRELALMLAAAPELAEALLECRRVLGIKIDFVPLGPASVLAPAIDAALAKAGVR